MHRPLPKWIVQRPIAHRGLHSAAAGIPENSIAAFEAAAAAGYPAELDVRVTRDGFAVVFHDAALGRLTGGSGEVATVDSNQLQRLRLMGTDEPVPLLVDVLEAVAGRVPLLIEIKNEGAVGGVESATLDALAAYDGAAAVQSFHPQTLVWFARHAPERPRGLLSGDFRESEMDGEERERLRNLEYAGVADPDFIGYDVRCLPHNAVGRLRGAGTPVLGWTVRSAAQAHAARRHCDNIIFEGFAP
jgi:glycerophosphoryl diester phosphodiesterase